jgi:ABC-type branched-subunit amino acid transport system substrate-binding protein
MTAAQVLQAGVQGCGKVDQDCIAEWLRNNQVDTASGKLKFDAEGLPEPRGAIVQVQQSKNVVIFPKDLATGEAVYPLK